MAERDQIIPKTRELRQEFARLVREIDQDQLDLAVQSARKMADNVENLLKEIGPDLMADFKANRLSSLPNDVASISKLESAPVTPDKLPEISQIVANLSRHIGAINGLVRMTYPTTPFSPRAFFARYGKIGVAVLAVVTVAIVGVVGYLNHDSKRHGLVGRYYAGTNFHHPERTRIDRSIDLRMGKGGPFGDWRRDDLSVRWTGYVHVPTDDHWIFSTWSDDGVKLSVGGRLIISNWTNHRAIENRAELKLKPGYYPIVLEYYEGRASAAIMLQWLTRDMGRPVVIPAANLFTSARYLKSGIDVFETLPDDAIISAPTVGLPVAAPAPPAPAPVVEKPAESAKKPSVPAAPKTPVKK